MDRSMMSPPTHTIVEYFYPPESSGHRCGYCKSPNSNYSHGMWAHTISPDNYERLINLGWRRSGSYLYMPMNEKVCCPMYTIRNLSTTVDISKSQRKVLKRFKRYIADGVVPSKPDHKNKHNNSSKMEDGMIESEERMDEVQPEVPENNRPKKKRECRQIVAKGSETLPRDPSLLAPSAPLLVVNPTTGGTLSSTSSKKPHPLKKKHLRRERKREKLIARGQDPDEFFRRNERNRVAELENFFKPDPADKLRFHTKLVKVDSPEFEDTFKLEHALYQKYQMHTHGDSSSECRASQFRRFLCDNPFKDQDTNESTPQGTYHQQYYVNDKLVAVGVLDILPHCISSVYFFYDADYSFLSPGTLGALYEISLVNELNRSNPSIQYYYLGFYIHTCAKMRYKRKFRPCELVCPYTREWVRFDERLLKILDETRYAQFSITQTNLPRPDEDVRKVLLLHNRRICRYDNYANSTSQKQELETYVNLVTASIASNMLLFRSSTHEDDDDDDLERF